MATAAELVPRSILVLEQSDVRGPFYAAIFSAFRSKVNAYKEPVSIYVENLDVSRFNGPEYEEGLRGFLRIKYHDKPVGVIVAVGAGSLDYAIRWRPELWPGAPIVFGFVDEVALNAFDLPADVTGRTTRTALDDMVAAARAAVPDLRSIALLGDNLDTQPAYKHLVAQLPAVKAELEVMDLTGLPMAELLGRVATLPEKTAIVYTAIYSDGAGTYFPPADGVAMIATVANRPIVVSVETLIPRGAVGGYVTIPSVVGEEAASQALQLVDGVDISSIPVSVGTSLRPVFDWQAMERWGVDESRLPSGSEVRNRVPTIWMQFPREISAIALVLLLQSGMIAALLYEHRRRRRAEVESRTHMRELAHLNRRATAGEMSASIAHELNQPLGAILALAETSEILLDNPEPDMDLIREVVADIKQENQRASEVIVRLRRLLTKAQVDMEAVDLNQTVAEVFRFVAFQASEADVDLQKFLADSPILVQGDPIQLQQVVLNLVMNGVDATREKMSGPRVVTAYTSSLGGMAQISIADTGHGIPEDEVNRVFDPFFTTKDQGMGMGLSIVRTIIEGHGGSVRAESLARGGAVFHVELPLIKPATE